MDTQHDALGRHHRTQLLAYYLWEDRGRPIGDPETDWFHAEAQLESEKPAVIAMAEAVGGALGTVAGFVTKL